MLRGLLAGLVALLVAAPAAGAQPTVDLSGPFTARFTSGYVKLADGQITVPLSAAAPVTIAGTIDPAGNVTAPAGGIVFPGYSTTFAGIPVAVQMHPVDASATIAMPSGTVRGLLRAYFAITAGAATCTVGSESAPVEIGLSTDPPGIPYDAGTGSITLAGDQTSLLGGTCSDPAYTSILNSPIFGAGHNQVRLSGTLDRGVNGGLPQNASGNPCAVPKLRAMRLAAARRALKASGCRAGHVTRRASRAKRGTVIGQSSRAGTLLPAGAKVALVVSKGVH